VTLQELGIYGGVGSARERVVGTFEIQLRPGGRYVGIVENRWEGGTGWRDELKRHGNYQCGRRPSVMSLEKSWPKKKVRGMAKETENRELPLIKSQSSRKFKNNKEENGAGFDIVYRDNLMEGMSLQVSVFYSTGWCMCT